MYMYMYIYRHICIYIYICVYVYTCVYVCLVFVTRTIIPTLLYKCLSNPVNANVPRVVTTLSSSCDATILKFSRMLAKNLCALPVLLWVRRSRVQATVDTRARAQRARHSQRVCTVRDGRKGPTQQRDNVKWPCLLRSRTTCCWRISLAMLELCPSSLRGK